MSWIYNGRKYWYHNGKRYSKKINKRKRIGYWWNNGKEWRRTSYDGYIDAKSAGRRVKTRELYDYEQEII